VVSPVEALVRWQHAAGPFWPYVCAAPFLGLDDEIWRVRRPVRRLTRQQRALADTLGGGAPSGGLSMVIVELPPEPVLAIAPLLVQRGWYVVPVIQRWVASPAVLPCRRLIETLLHGAEHARRPASPHGVVLVADGIRSGPKGYPALVPGRIFDNRYEYQICRFPSLDFLAAHAVRDARWITDQPGGAIGPDLAPYLEDLLRAGIDVEVASWPSRLPGA
jgi:hypothetical protein